MSEDVLVRAAAIVVLLAVASAAWWLATRRRGEVRPAATQADSRRGSGGRERTEPDLSRVLSAADVTPGAGATVVQLSSEYCSPCRRSAATWSAVAVADPRLGFTEIDAGDHLALTREFAVLSTPTSLLFDAHGAYVGRLGGAPTRAQANRALAGILAADPPTTSHPTTTADPTTTHASTAHATTTADASTAHASTAHASTAHASTAQPTTGADPARAADHFHATDRIGTSS